MLYLNHEDLILIKYTIFYITIFSKNIDILKNILILTKNSFIVEEILLQLSKDKVKLIYFYPLLKSWRNSCIH